MKASYYTGNQTFTVEPATAIGPAPQEIRVKVAFCGLCGTDLHVYHGHMDARVGSHRIIGHEMSGTVEAVGGKIDDLIPGDKVVIRPLVACNECPACDRGHSHICQNLKFLGLDSDGALQQIWTVPRHTVHKLPASLSLRDAALVEPVAVACHDVVRSRLAPGEDVLVIGGGPIGILIGMVAKDKGGHVTIAEVNAHRLAMAEKMGFSTLNPKECDVGESVYRNTGNKGADIIFEVSGTQPGVDCMTEAAATRARIVMVAIHASPPKVDLFKFFWREIELFGARVYTSEDFESAIDLIARGAIDCDSVITNIQGLDKVGEVLADMSGNPASLKSLIQVAEETPA